jgi:hypothetical protein
MDPPEKREARDRLIWEQREKARQSSAAFTELVRSRADWLADRVIESRMDSKMIVPLVQASYLYRLHVLRLGFHDVSELSALELDKTWRTEHERRLALVRRVKELALLPHTPGKSRLRQLARVRRRMASVFSSALRRIRPDASVPAGVTPAGADDSGPEDSSVPETVTMP